MPMPRNLGQRMLVLTGFFYALSLVSVHSLQAQGIYETASLQGTYAYINQTGNVGSAGLIEFDGNGKVTMTIKVNVPDDAGGRKVVLIDGLGTYTVEPSGIGVATIKFEGADGDERILDYDFVITQVSQKAAGGLVAAEVFSILRSGGLKGQLVTPTWKRRD